MNNYMKAVVKAHPSPGFEFREVEIPRPGPGEILVRVAVAAICGTDVHIVKWDRWAASRIVPPRIFGHEFCGEVVEVGLGVREPCIGDLVTGETHITCKSCFYCRTGQSHLCRNGRVIGLDVDGAFAEYIVFPAENAWKLDEGISLEVGATLNPLGNAVYAVLSAEVAGNSVAVIGCGPVGLYAVMVAKAAGASTIIAIDTNPYRLELARSIGADLCVNPDVEDPIAVVGRCAGGWGADLVLEMSGHPSGVHIAFSVVRAGGCIRMVGIPENPVSIDLSSQVIFPEVDIRGISGRQLYRTYYQALGLIKAGMDVTSVITHRLPFEDFDRGIELMLSGQCGKVLLDMAR